MTTLPIKSALAAVLFLALASLVAAAQKVRLGDEPVVLPALLFGATPREEHGLVAVSSGVLGAGLVLPHSKEWEFEIRDDGSVTGGDGHYQISFAAWEATAATERDYLEAVLQRMENDSGPHVQNVSFMEIDADLVLRYQSQPRQLPADVRPLNPWWWHYWSVERVEQGWADVHLTVLEPSKELPGSDPKLKLFLGRGLRALPPRPLEDD